MLVDEVGAEAACADCARMCSEHEGGLERTAGCCGSACTTSCAKMASQLMWATMFSAVDRSCKKCGTSQGCSLAAKRIAGKEIV